jgi:hypothetical protein
MSVGLYMIRIRDKRRERLVRDAVFVRREFRQFSEFVFALSFALIRAIRVSTPVKNVFA